MGSIDNIVALGTIIEDGNNNSRIWDIKLGTDLVRVSIDICRVEDAVIPIAMGKRKLMVIDVIGTQVPWPKSLVIIEHRKVNLFC